MKKPMPSPSIPKAEAHSEKRVTTAHTGESLPPTPEDKVLSLKHHKDSVRYNLHHASDHFAATADHLTRMCDQGHHDVARAQAKKSARVLAKMQAELAPFLNTSVTPDAK